MSFQFARRSGRFLLNLKLICKKKKKKKKKAKKTQPLLFRFLPFRPRLSLKLSPPSTLSLLPSSAKTRNGRGGAMYCARRWEGCGRGADRKKFDTFSGAGARAGHFLPWKENSRPEQKRKRSFYAFRVLRLGIWKVIASPLRFRRKTKNASRHPSVFQAGGGKREREKGGRKERRNEVETIETLNQDGERERERESKLPSLFLARPISTTGASLTSSLSKYFLSFRGQRRQGKHPRKAHSGCFFFPFFFLVVFLKGSFRALSSKYSPGGARLFFPFTENSRVEKRVQGKRRLGGSRFGR